MNDNTTELDPIEPAQAVELFLDDRSTELAESTLQNYRYRLGYFVEWCELENLDDLNELTGRHTHRFRLWRRENGDLTPLTLKNHMQVLRTFLRWAGAIEAVPQNLYDKVLLPTINPEDEKRDETLEAENAREILEYLSKYNYASFEHTMFATLWQTGVRIGTLVSLDISDIDYENEALRFKHRPADGTPLKNGKSGQRPVAVTPSLLKLIDDYMEDIRKEVVDDYGREPLFTTSSGRASIGSIRRNVYKITSPCFRDADCPNCRETPAKKCPEAVSPHSIRRGSITHYLSEDVPLEIVSDRMNVSRDVLKKHYDRRSPDVKLEQRRGYLDNI